MKKGFCQFCNKKRKGFVLLGKKQIIILIFFCIILGVTLFFLTPVASAKDASKDEFYNTIYEEIESLSQTELEKCLGELTEEQRALFQNKNWKEVVKCIVNGESLLSYTSITDFILSVIQNNALKYVSLAASIIGISVLTSILSSMKSGFMEEGIGSVIYFVGYAVILTITLVSAVGVTESAYAAISSIQRQMAVLLPIMLGFLTGAGGSVSSGVYASATAFLSNGILSVITSVILPILKLMVLLAVFGHVSEGLKLGELFAFLGNVCKWLILTSLTVYSFVLGVQGITAATHDGVSYKLLKYTVGNSLPLVGGTVKDGFDIILASFLVVKNALGVFALIILAGIAVGEIMSLILFSWSLKLASGILQPIGDNKTCGFLAKMGSVIQYYVAVLGASIYLYAITLFAVISASAGVI